MILSAKRIMEVCELACENAFLMVKFKTETMRMGGTGLDTETEKHNLN